jgi:triacylglycerol lipase
LQTGLVGYTINIAMTNPGPVLFFLRPFAAFLVLLALAGCTSQVPKNSGANIYSILQYPVVLVHGIAAHDRKSIFDYWGRIPETLEAQGVRIFPGNTDAWGGFEHNGAILKDTIEKVLEATGAAKVNIIAHSRGGLDARYCIWAYDLGDRVASLTSIATPHHGAELADLVYEQGMIDSPLGKRVLAVLGRLYGDEGPALPRAIYELTTDNMILFNQQIIPDTRVFYQSIYTLMNRSADDLFFYFTHRYIESLSGPNDGVVSARSARWGDRVTEIAGGISHREIVDMKKKKISGVDIPLLYVDIVNELRQRGY